MGRFGCGGAFGQLAFFVEFLNLSGLYEHWRADAPLRYVGPHSSKCEDILSTWFLSLLAGHRRYAHINAIHFDGVIYTPLGMKRVVSKDTVRRYLTGDRGVGGQGLVAEPPGWECAVIVECTVAVGCRCDGQAAVWPSGRCGVRLPTDKTQRLGEHRTLGHHCS